MLNKRVCEINLPIINKKEPHRYKSSIKSRWEVKNNLVRLGEVLEDLPDNRFAVSL